MNTATNTSAQPIYGVLLQRTTKSGRPDYDLDSYGFTDFIENELAAHDNDTADDCLSAVKYGEFVDAREWADAEYWNDKTEQQGVGAFLTYMVNTCYPIYVEMHVINGLEYLGVLKKDFCGSGNNANVTKADFDRHLGEFLKKVFDDFPTPVPAPQWINP